MDILLHDTLLIKISAATPEEDAKGIYVGFKPSGELGLKGGFHTEVKETP